MGPRRTRPDTLASSRRRVTAIASPSSVKKTPSEKRAVTPKTPVADHTQHDAAVAIASLDIDRGLRERIERMARRVQRLQRELGEVWEDMRRLLDPAAVAVEEVHPVTSGGDGKALGNAGHFYTAGEAGEYVLVRDFNAAAKRAGADTTVVSLESLGYTKRQKKIEGKNQYVIQGIRLC
mmetsp:Transcript_8271/g.37163  ORF Transcript_8271/g.37163 Transcript_8271/m.37163 type:complete len:179 (+) Transcript_8271:117-653(+)